MRSFAEQLGVNVSSISRIISGQAETVSIELIAKIAACSLSSGVTLKDLMDAQGLAIVRLDRTALQRFVRNCRGAIADELISRGYSVEYPELDRSSKYERMFDFSIRTNALPKSGKWLYDVKLLRPNHQDPGNEGLHSLFDMYMAYYYQGGQAARISMVVTSEWAYDTVTTYTKDVGRIPDEISIILVDLIDGRVGAEYVLPTEGADEAKIIF